MTAYDAIVIGTGQAAPYVTSRLAGAGMKVGGIERNAFDMKAGHGPERRGLGTWSADSQRGSCA